MMDLRISDFRKANMKQVSKKVLRAVLVTALGSSGSIAQAAPIATVSQAPQQGQPTPVADNTKVNSRDKVERSQTPQAQSNAKADRKLLATVRRAIFRDKSLSVMAHNIKILAEGGVVTLRGPVQSDDEKRKVEALAKSVSGVSSVDNKIDIKSN
ncbi:BON domain-containing protein [Pseudoduganella sp. RAF19]|uniref:BON domain-containing protein n=2 Tax=unclassified Pseudoduganella TaxID=2637179 RepID=UPI003F98B35E